MAKVIIDLEMIETLEQRSYCKMSPAERIIVSYVHNFREGFYGSCTHLSKVCGLCEKHTRVVVNRLKRRKVLILKGENLFLNSLYLKSENVVYGARKYGE